MFDVMPYDPIEVVTLVTSLIEKKKEKEVILGEPFVFAVCILAFNSLK